MAEKLLEFKNKRVIVLAIPRGGVPVGVEVAKALNAEFDLIMARKIPLPQDPEAGIGAISEDGSTVWKKQIIQYYGITKEEQKELKKQQIKEIKRRIKTLRKGKKLPELKNKTVILVDDGLAMGSTMQAAAKTVKNKKPAKLIIAVPVAGKQVLEETRKKATTYCLETPPFFQAVAQAYKYWTDLTDEDVLKTMKKRKKIFEFHENGLT